VATNPLRDELLRNLEKLSPEKQGELVAFARSLTESALPVRGTKGKDLVGFSGAIAPNDLEKIGQAIQEDCEQVDRSAW
jgi:hypothetical protein